MITWCVQLPSATSTCSCAIIWEVRCINRLHFHVAIMDSEIFSDILEALCNQTPGPEAGRRGRQIKIALISNHFSPYWVHILMGNDVCVSIWELRLPWPPWSPPTVRAGGEGGWSFGQCVDQDGSGYRDNRSTGETDGYIDTRENYSRHQGRNWNGEWCLSRRMWSDRGRGW